MQEKIIKILESYESLDENGNEYIKPKDYNSLSNTLLEAINYTRCCATLKDLKGNEIQIKSLSDLKKMYPEGTTFSVAGNGRELNYYVDGKVAYTRIL